MHINDKILNQMAPLISALDRCADSIAHPYGGDHQAGDAQIVGAWEKFDKVEAVTVSARSGAMEECCLIYQSMRGQNEKQF